MIDLTVPEDGSLMSNGTQHTTEEKLKILWSTNSIYEVARLKPLGNLILILPCRKKI